MWGRLTLLSYPICARHYAQFNLALNSNFVLIYSFSRWKNWGSGKVSNMPKVTQLVSGRAGRQQSLFESLEALDWKWSWGISPFKGGGNGFMIRSKFFTGYPTPISNHTPYHGKVATVCREPLTSKPNSFCSEERPPHHSLTSFRSLPKTHFSAYCVSPH